ncbi:hypothetical protein SDC9_203149 [bioreactor metagenome]|uniref:N-acetyltransferase domain-containing protein n=1 Tax=bioreactor metagenome TaxID=1076179 RepID=A0A645IWG2_9ZZZZ
MEFLIGELMEERAKQLCAWRYPGEYAVYDFLPWDIAVQQKWSITDPIVRESDFRSVSDEKGNFIGFFRMSGSESGRVEIGLGLKPELCGLGLGKDFVKAVTRYALARHPDCLPYMEVRTFNLRAVKCYKSCGYTVVLRHNKIFPWGGGEFFLMEYHP